MWIEVRDIAPDLFRLEAMNAREFGEVPKGVIELREANRSGIQTAQYPRFWRLHRCSLDCPGQVSCGLVMLQLGRTFLIPESAISEQRAVQSGELLRSALDKPTFPGDRHRVSSITGTELGKYAL